MSYESWPCYIAILYFDRYVVQRCIFGYVSFVSQIIININSYIDILLSSRFILYSER